MPVRLFAPLLLALAPCLSCRTPSTPGESQNLTRAKALVEETAKDFEKLVAKSDGLEGDAARARQLGDQLRRAIEGRRSESEALAKLLTDDEKAKLQEFGKQRLGPLVRQLEDKLNTLPRRPAPTAPEAAAAAPEAVTPVAAQPVPLAPLGPAPLPRPASPAAQP